MQRGRGLRVLQLDNSSTQSRGDVCCERLFIPWRQSTAEPRCSAFTTPRSISPTYELAEDYIVVVRSSSSGSNGACMLRILNFTIMHTTLDCNAHRAACCNLPSRDGLQLFCLEEQRSHAQHEGSLKKMHFFLDIFPQDSQ